MRHWLSSRAAFTRPNLGTAISMSKTFAVETNSGIEEDPLDLHPRRLQVPLELGPPDTDVVRPLKRFHPLIE